MHPFRAALAQLRPDYRDVGDVAVRDPALGAVKDVLVAFAAGGGAHAARVRAEVGLREPEAADGAATRQLRQPFATLVLRSEGEDGVHDETRLDAREGAKPAVAALELLVDETVGDVAEVCTAVLLGQRRAEEAELGQARDDPHREAAFAECLGHQGEILVLHETARRVAHHPLLGR